MELTWQNWEKIKRSAPPVRIDDDVAIAKVSKCWKICAPDASLVMLTDDIQITAVTPRNELLPEPEDTLQRIIDETGMKDNKDQEWAFRIAGEHFVNGTHDQLFMYVMGIGGLGKSYVIDVLTLWFQRWGASEKMLQWGLLLY